MKNITDYFVPYNLAIQLKEKGFKEDCIAYYPNIIDGICILNNKNTEGNYVEIKSLPQRGVSAPLFHQVINWFEKEHKILIIREAIWDSWNWALYYENGDRASNVSALELDKAIEQAIKFI